MERKTAHDFDQDLLILFDAYVHGALDRRGFLDKAAKYAVGGVTAAMLLDQLSPNFVEAQVVPPTDKRIKAEVVEYDSPSGNGKMKGYFVRPANAKGQLPGVLVIHENRGLNPHIEDIARRMALDGFVAFAPDALTPLGGYPGNEDKARELFGKLDAGQDPGGHGRRRGLAEGTQGSEGQDRRGGLLLGRRDGQLPGHAAPRSRGRGGVLRQRADPRGRGQDQGPAAHPVGGDGRAHQRGLARRTKRR